MTISTQPDNINNLLSTRFVFRNRRTPLSTYYCQSVELPGASISVVNQPTIFNPIRRPGGEVSHGALSIRFMVDEDLKNWNEIFTWIKQCSDYVDFEDYLPPSQHLSEDSELLVLSNTGNPRHKFTFSGLFPVSLGSLNFDSTIGDSSYMTCNASFQFTSMNLINLNRTT